MIILFFREDEIFDVIGDDIQLSGNKKIITKKQNNADWNNNCYGITVIPSISEITCKWNLSICGNMRRFLMKILRIYQ